MTPKPVQVLPIVPPIGLRQETVTACPHCGTRFVVIYEVREPRNVAPDPPEATEQP